MQDASQKSSSSQYSPAMALITLNAKEEQLRQLLLAVAASINESLDNSEPVTLRWAGGWVRDKLLQRPSNDIDTAINCMTGLSFCLKMAEYLENPANLMKHGIRKGDMGSIHTIAANPEKSKKLETATIKLLGMDLDFVNLRKETYSADSRTPQMEFGTPIEDALRRDATINALFYNIHSNEVEDYVGGLKDLELKVVRTPMDPRQTFLDDPLRVLRFIRFSSRLSFHIDKGSLSYMADASIQEALTMKISRERVGIEVEKMLKERETSKPFKALQLIDELQLYVTVFSDPAEKDMPKLELSHWNQAYSCLQFVMSKEIFKVLTYDDCVTRQPADVSCLAWTLSAVTPWCQYPTMVQTGAGKPKTSLAVAAVREGLKLSSRVVKVITAAFQNFEEIIEVKAAVCNDETLAQDRAILGLKIRRWDKNGGFWRLQILFAMLVEAFSLPSNNKGYDNLVAEWSNVLHHLQQMDLMNIELVMPLIDGKELQERLQAVPGRWMSQALELCLEWQFRNPGVSDEKALIETIRTKSDELKITYKKRKS